MVIYAINLIEWKFCFLFFDNGRHSWAAIRMTKTQG